MKREALPLGLYFNPLGCLQALEGSTREVRQALEHNFSQRWKISEIGHRWMQLAILLFLVGVECGFLGLDWTQLLFLATSIIVCMHTACIASIWWVLGMMKKDMDRGLI